MGGVRWLMEGRAAKWSALSRRRAPKKVIVMTVRSQSHTREFAGPGRRWDDSVWREC